MGLRHPVILIIAATLFVGLAYAALSPDPPNAASMPPKTERLVLGAVLPVGLTLYAVYAK